MSTSLSPICIPRTKPAPLGITHYMEAIDEISLELSLTDETTTAVRVTDHIALAPQLVDEQRVRLIIY